MTRELEFRQALTPAGMVSDCVISVSPEGRIESIRPGAAEGAPDGDLALPGMPNAHSHAFQRALAGYGEVPRGKDSFWSWREAMYRLAGRVTPEDMYAIASQAFAEMLAGGFTSVAEFHYLHHLPDGGRGPEMGRAVIEAAQRVGIRLVMLPVYYETGGFGRPPGDGQRRFVHDSPGDFVRLLEGLDAPAAGIAPHSLRAVPAARLKELVDAAGEVLGNDFPVHIHIAEQTAEVDECRRAHGRTPVELLAETVELNDRWNLVHATHVTDAELASIAASGANVVLCPITEAYLGDGIFPAVAWRERGRSVAVGSDSNCRIDAVEELRWLEYGQRLHHHRRSLLADERGLGRALWSDAAAVGARALGQPVGAIEEGRMADFVVLDVENTTLAAYPPETVLDGLLVNGDAGLFRRAFVGGECVADAGGVREQSDILAAFARTTKGIHQ